MVLGFSQARTDDVATLIARKNYAKAIELIKAQIKGQRPDTRLRLQLADVLALAGKVPEAVNILGPLADELAREGFAAKAISVLKKIQKLDPGRRDVDEKLASLIEQKQRQATVTFPPVVSSAMPEIGMEEIGFEPPQPAPAEAAPPAAPSPSEPPAPGPVTVPPPVVDRDLFIDEVIEGEAVEEVPPVEVAEGEAPGAEPMSEGLFAAELLSLVEEAFKEVPAAEDGVPPPAGEPGPAAGSQIVVSPLFKDLSVDELVAVIHGLKLLTFERGNVIIREGQPGDSLYMLTAGTVKAFVKKGGKQVPIGELNEGGFFGEVSMLTGQPRTATVVATNHCELLELDRPALDSIARRHPHVMDVLRQFARERSPRV